MMPAGDIGDRLQAHARRAPALAGQGLVVIRIGKGFAHRFDALAIIDLTAGQLLLELEQAVVHLDTFAGNLFQRGLGLVMRGVDPQRVRHDQILAFAQQAAPELQVHAVAHAFLQQPVLAQQVAAEDGRLVGNGRLHHGQRAAVDRRVVDLAENLVVRPHPACAAHRESTGRQSSASRRSRRWRARTLC
ncbi:hypothetical protein G6F68_015291 [Rhizopus microsporus]|nr:hypothetical protein G6F68_015291 [Rhizopus microsporus]